MDSILKRFFGILMIAVFLAGLLGTEAMAMGKWPHKTQKTGTTSTKKTPSR